MRKEGKRGGIYCDEKGRGERGGIYCDEKGRGERGGIYCDAKTYCLAESLLCQ